MTTEAFDSNIETTCQWCHRGFTLRVVYAGDDDGGEAVYFRCPHCEHRYPVSYMTARGVAIRERLQAALTKARQGNGKPKDLDRVERLRTALEAETTEGERDD